MTHDIAELTGRVNTAITILGPMVENPVITNTAEPRVLFDMVHLGDSGSTVQHWDLTLNEALLLLTGAIDGSFYTLQLTKLAEECNRSGLN